MTYLELERQNKRLKELLARAAGAAEGLDDAWYAEVDLALNPPKATVTGGVSRLDGEECGTCKHSSTFHAGGSTICCKVDCECMKFVPTGKANEQAR